MEAAMETAIVEVDQLEPNSTQNVEKDNDNFVVEISLGVKERSLCLLNSKFHAQAKFHAQEFHTQEKLGKK
eukprot:7613288-Prorocentrum_lima.AAC.1